MAQFTYTEALDEIYGLFKTTWEAGTAAIVGYVPTVYWPGSFVSNTVEGNKFAARVSIQTVMSPQATLAQNVGGLSQKRYFNVGLLVVQIFCPLIVVNSYYLGQQLGVLVRDAYRQGSSSSSVWYDNARLRELPAQDAFHRFDVITECRYDDIG